MRKQAVTGLNGLRWMSQEKTSIHYETRSGQLRTSYDSVRYATNPTTPKREARTPPCLNECEAIRGLVYMLLKVDG